MENKFGKLSTISMVAAKKGDRTILRDLSFTAPFKVMRPFYEKKDTMSVMALTASAGIMAGDRQEFHITVEEGARMEYISQAFEKIHRMESGYARRDTYLKVEAGATLYYTPLPTIPFAGSDFRNQVHVELADQTSSLLYSEILTAGRIAHGEEFGYRKYKNLVQIYEKDHMIYRDYTCYEPDRMDLGGFGMYEGYTHLANMIFVNMPKTDSWIQQIRSLIDQTDDMEGGVTRCESGDLVVRILGKRADRLLKIQQRIREIK